MKSSSNKANEVLKNVLARVKPTSEVRAKHEALVKRVLSKMRACTPKNVEVVLAGSMAKGTNLREVDLDVFLLFPKTCSNKDLEVLGLKYAKKAVAPNKYEIGYAEHPYLRAKIEGVRVDVVPSFKIENISEMGSSVDRSQLHTKYVLKKLREEQKDEVRLLKQFLKGQGVYGAEAKTEGFSGYLCELLIIHYSSFTKLLEEARSWHKRTIDIENQWEKDEPRKRFDTPLVVIDPVDRNRNVAAAVSATSLTKFIYAARAFIKKPSINFFFEEELKVKKSIVTKQLKARGTDLLLLTFKAPDVVPDILWPQLRKATQSIVRHLELADFIVFGYDYWSEEKESKEKNCAILIELENAKLPNVKFIQGPGIRHEQAVDNFIAAHRNAVDGPWFEHNNVVVIERRKSTDANTLLKEIGRQPDKYAIPSHVSKKIKSLKILKNEEALNGKFYEFVGKYVAKRVMAWMKVL
ncbi:MAG: CCA tRNA nucleotidyltransferase [Candidatus Micrarchaeota archaeon]